MNEEAVKTDEKKLPETAAQMEKLVEGIFGLSFDIIIQRFRTVKAEALLLHVEGMSNKDLIDRDIIMPLKSSEFNGDVGMAIHAVFTTTETVDDMISKLLEGNVILFYEGKPFIYVIEFKQWEMRSVDSPESEMVTRGPKEGFTENLITNTSLLRRKLRTTNLTVERMVLGKQSNTAIAIVYMHDIVNRLVLRELKKRLSKIDVDAVFETGQIEQFIEKKHFSLIPCAGVTQKPDVAAAKILEGRVAIICDGTPHVLTIPELFIENLHTSEDYYLRTPNANFLRILRMIALVITILLPGLSLAIITFSPEMMPFVFLSTFIAATEKTPLPEAAEVFFLIIMFELLKEAGTRLPKTFGTSITIVGALIIGEAAVTAGIVGAPSVIIVALTSVASLLVPNLNEFSTYYRFLFLLLGATMGIIGVGTGIILIMVHLISYESFGIPVLSSFNKYEMRDGFIKAPATGLIMRPTSLVKNNVRRANYKEEK